MVARGLVMSTVEPVTTMTQLRTSKSAVAGVESMTGDAEELGDREDEGY
jgi:hypothetical protein